MKLQLQQLMPVPLARLGGQRMSAIWLQDVVWDNGECIFIQAPSGTGKTTLAHLLFGLRKDYTGTFYWDEKPAKAMNSNDWALLRSRDVSLIFQDLRLLPELTAWENLEIKRTITNTIAQNEAEDWMKRLGIGDKKNALTQTLSYGEQQRLCIVRALLQPFKWLLMDEPFSHLDEANRLKAAALISEITGRNGASVLMADLDDNHYFHYTQKLLL